MATFNNRNGDEVFRGIDGEYNQVDYRGSLSEFRIYRNADGSVTVAHPTLGTDILFGIDGFWFNGDRSWYSIDDAIAQTPGEDTGEDIGGDNGGVTIDANGVYTGDATDNIITGTAQNNLFYGGQGDDVINGNGGDYNQVEYNGALSDYTVSRNADGSVTVVHAVWGTDTLTDIDGLWFMGEARWYSIADAIANTDGTDAPNITAWGVLMGTDANDTLGDSDDVNALYGGLGDDRLVGRDGNYSQAEYDGAAADYTFTQAADGSVIVTHPIYGRDTLTDIDGFWFLGESRWYATADLVDDNNDVSTGEIINGVITGTNAVDDRLVGDAANNTFYAGMGTDTILGGAGTDTLRIDGDIIEWTFALQDNGTLVMTHPTWGENTLTGIEQVFSLRAGQLYTVEQAIQLTDQLPEFRLDADNVLNGTNGNDNMIGSVEGTNFYGGLGDDFYMGSMTNFDQINYDGARADYTFMQNADGSVTVVHAIWGTDSFADIEGLFFNGGDGEFILVADLFA